MTDVIDQITEPLTADEQTLLDDNQAAETEPVTEPEAEPVVEPAVEPEAKGKVDDPEKKPEAEPEAEKTGEVIEPQVNLGALHEERALRRAEQAKVADLTKKFDAQETRLTDILERLNPPDPGPDYDEDPEGHLLHQAGDTAKRLEKLEEKGQAQDRQTEQAAAEKEIIDNYGGSVRRFTADNPDFPAAYDFLAKAMDSDLEARGVSDPAERVRTLNLEEGRMAMRAIDAGNDPAKQIYDYAVSRGYKHAESKPESDADKLATLKAGQDNSSSLSDMAGTGDTGAVTARRLLDLDGDDFDAEWDKLHKAGRLG